MRSPFPASNEVPAKQIASKHPTPPLSSGPLPAPPPRPPAIRSQQSVPSGNSRQLPAHAFTSRARNTHKLPQAPLPPSERPAILRVPSSLPSTGQSSERAPSFPRQTLARIAAPTHLPPKSRTPPGIPKSPNSSRHPETQKKRSRHCAGSAPNYLQVSTRSYLSRSESGSGSCSSPYC